MHPALEAAGRLKAIQDTAAAVAATADRLGAIELALAGLADRLARIEATLDRTIPPDLAADMIAVPGIEGRIDALEAKIDEALAKLRPAVEPTPAPKAPAAPAPAPTPKAK